MIKYIFALFITSYFLTATTTYASIIQYDWETTGDISIVYDDETNLEWLKLTQTVGESYNYIESQFEVGGEYEGFRFAGLNDVETLINNAGSSFGVCYFCLDEIPPMEKLITLIGSGYTFASGISTWGYVLSNSSPLNDVFFDGVLMSVDYNIDKKGAQQTGGFKDRNPYGNLGGFLVREGKKVPEPSVIALFCIGFLGLGIARQKRNIR
jgi:hypothetical protein